MKIKEIKFFRPKIQATTPEGSVKEKTVPFSFKNDSEIELISTEENQIKISGNFEDIHVTNCKTIFSMDYILIYGTFHSNEIMPPITKDVIKVAFK